MKQRHKGVGCGDVYFAKFELLTAVLQFSGLLRVQACPCWIYGG